MSEIGTGLSIYIDQVTAPAFTSDLGLYVGKKLPHRLSTVPAMVEA